MRRNANDHDPRDFWAAGEQLGIPENRSDDKIEHDAVEVGVAAEARVALVRTRTKISRLPPPNGFQVCRALRPPRAKFLT